MLKQKRKSNFNIKGPNILKPTNQPRQVFFQRFLLCIFCYCFHSVSANPFYNLQVYKLSKQQWYLSFFFFDEYILQKTDTDQSKCHQDSFLFYSPYPHFLPPPLIHNTYFIIIILTVTIYLESFLSLVLVDF